MLNLEFEDGVLREVEKVPGGYVDLVLHSMSRRDWLARKATR